MGGAMAEVREAVLAKIGVGGGLRAVARSSSCEPSSPQRSSGLALTLALAANLAAVAGLLTWNLDLRGALGEGLESLLGLAAGRTSALAPNGDSDAHARVFVEA